MSAQCTECEAETFTCAACRSLQDLASLVDAEAVEADRSVVASLQARLDSVSELTDVLTGEAVLLIQKALNGYVHTG